MLQTTPMLTATSLLYPEGFLSPLEIDVAVERALAEDLGREQRVASQQRAVWNDRQLQLAVNR